MRLATFDDWARAHHGIVTPHSTGLSRSSWYRAIAAGTFIQVHPNVARLPGAAITPEQRMIAGVLAVGPDAIASHRSAARLWGIPRADDEPVDIITARNGTETRLDGVVIHHPTDRRRLVPQRRYNIACTNILRTLLDLGAVDPDGVTEAVCHTIAAGLASLGALRTAVLEHSQRGRSGIGPLRVAIDTWSIDDRPADSLLEATMRRLVTEHRLAAVEFHPMIEGYEVDFRVIGTPVLLECDGWTHHGHDRLGFERDRVRDADLLAAGWIVVRFSYRAVVTTPSRTADRIRRAVEQWASTPAPDAT